MIIMPRYSVVRIVGTCLESVWPASDSRVNNKFEFIV